MQIGDAEALDEVLLGGVLILAVADDGDDLIGVVRHQLQALQDMLALLGLFQVVGGAAGHYLKLEFEVLLQHFLQGHHLGHAVFQRQHNNAEAILQLGVAV